MTQSPALSLFDLHSSLLSLLPSWTDQTQTSDESNVESIRLCKIDSLPSSSTQPLVITHSLVVNTDFTWKLIVHGHEVLHVSTPLLSAIPEHLNKQSLAHLLTAIDSAIIFPGNPDERFIEMAKSHKGKLLTKSGEIRAYTDSGFPLSIEKNVVSTTIRTSGCEIVTIGGRCSKCNNYRRQLRMAHSRHSRKSSDSLKFTNNRYLNTPQKAKKLKSLQARASVPEKEIKRLKLKIEKLSTLNGVIVDEPLHQELSTIMDEQNQSIESKFPEGTFRRLFWQQQLKAAQITDSRQMRWHPMMIKWCLNLKLLSTSAYHSLRTSGFNKLPSERTLRDYTHYFKSEPGFQHEVDKMLVEEVSLGSCTDWQKYVVILFDEMKVKESLVYDKHSAQVIGFAQLGDLNDQLDEMERSDVEHPSVATHILGIMVRGVFSSLHFPYAHFPTTGVTGATLFSVV